MAIDQENIIGYLSENYPGPVGIRSIWELAGGLPGEIQFTDSAKEMWSELWQAAEGPEGVTHTALIREALYDRPGEALLLTCLENMAREACPDAADAVPEMILALTVLGPDFEPVHMLLVLESFPECTEIEAFSVLTPRVQGVFEIAEREVLEKQIAEIRKMGSIPTAALSAVDTLEQSLWATTAP